MKQSVGIFIMLFLVSALRAQQSDQISVSNPQLPQGQSGWARVPIDTNLYVVLGFVSRDTCYAVNSASYYRSVDGGSSWQRITWPIPLSGGISFINPQLGFIALGSGHTAYHTSNGGQIWTSADDGDQLVGVVCAVTPDTCFLSGSSFISRTTDSGKSWSVQELNAAGLRSISFSDSKHGVVVGSAQPGPLPHHELTAGCFTTNDGGQTWVQKYTGASQEFTGVAYFDPIRLIAVGVNSELFRSSDSGTSWSKAISPASLGVIDLSGVSTYGSFGIAVGASGTILATSDAGLSWYQQVSGVSSDLGSVQLFDNKLALASGDAGVILRTTNGGTDWVQVAPTSSVKLSTRAFQDAETPNIEIEYSLPQMQNVNVSVYDLQSRKVANLANGVLRQSGVNRVLFNNASVPSGTYLYEITTNRYTASGKFSVTH